MTCDFFQRAAPGVQGLQPYQPGKPIEELEREYGIQNAIKLASNENPLGVSPRLLQSLPSVLAELARYPDGNGFLLKQALSNKHSVKMDTITLGNGSNEVLELIARAFVTPADSVIFSQYAFAVYPIVTQAIGATAIVTPARDWGYDLAAMQTAIQANTKVIFLANPNNPTGTWVDKTSLKTFLEAVPEHIIVVVDEAYFEYACENPAYPDSSQWLSTYPNLIVCRTFSKAYGLAGLRVGYALSDSDIANLLNRVRQPFNVNSLALRAATLVLQDTEHLQQSLAVNREGMQQLTEAFEEMGVEYIPSLGNFVTVKVKRLGVDIYKKLLFEGIIVRPLAPYQMPHHLRITVGLDEENFLLIEALRKVIS